MLIGIRVDASLKMGTGHTYRMLTLAHKLKSKGHKVFFVSRKLKGNLIDFVRNSFELLELPEPKTNECNNTHCSHAKWLEVDYSKEINQSYNAIKAHLEQSGQQKLDWLVIDHYALEKEYQLAMQSLAVRCLQVDDLADRAHHVDILLDQNYYQQGSTRYDGLLPQETLRLCGPSFALLRDDFSLCRKQLEPYEERFAKHQVVLFFGGIDLANETSKALKGLLSVESQDHFHVIIGINNPHKDQVTTLCNKYSDRVSLHVQVNNMTDFFASSYLYVGAVGATTWERCVMALPGLVCSVAENQTQLALEIDEANAHIYLGLNSKLHEIDYARAYSQLIANAELLKNQSKICEQLVDGDGAQTVVNRMEEMSNHDQV